ncbi:putative hemerythrin-like protein [Lachnellula subtilissima]|uniref:Putative hemerythrin-like protein n=1 Tax=Lachnellula subtilissima TaxID=602034 RepID=A0A8H8RDF1_9HELO|nr:putative hemerythrin-like protein [Lachnellula subtilissima]
MLVSEAIGADHQYLDECYENLKSAPTDDKIKWRNMLVWNLARHAISEELTVYPAMEKWLGEEGKALTKTDFEQHQAVKEDLYILQSLSPSDQKFTPLLEQLMHDLHTHIEHEKNEDMPRLEAKLSHEESEKIAKSFMRTKHFVPTKSHPGAPTFSSLAEGLAGLLAAPDDDGELSG